MNANTLEHVMAQLDHAFNKSRQNNYSDKRKAEHFEQLKKVFDKMIVEDKKSIDLIGLQCRDFIAKYLFSGLEFLDDSTINVTPYEIVICLNKALEDWVDTSPLIIVTSLSNKLNSYSFESYHPELLKQIKNIIYRLYKVKLDYRLIKINMPRLAVRDYLANVVLYHELGHFVDKELNFSERVFRKKYGKGYPTNSNTNDTLAFNHLMEFFADLFAAQYVGDASNKYLHHIAFGQEDSLTHPATKRRIEMVNKFLKDENDDMIIIFNETLLELGKEELKKRYKVYNDDYQLKNLIPEEINDTKDLHGIFKLGWDLWMAPENNFLKDFNPSERYALLNNLIEKSISNYHILENWKYLKS